MIVELCGIARLRAGTSRVDLRPDAATLGEALASLAGRHPGVVPEVMDTEGRLGRHFIASVSGGPFSRDPELELAPGDRIVIIGAQAGG